MTTQPLASDWANLQAASLRRTGRAEWRTLRAALVLVDAFAIAAAFALAYIIRFETDIPLFYAQTETPLPFYASLVLALIPVWLGIFGLYRLYDFNSILSGLDEYIRVVHATSMGMMVLIVVTFFVPTFVVARGWLVLTLLFSALTVGLGRFAMRSVVRLARVRDKFVTPVIIVGANEEGRAIARHLNESAVSGARVVGFLDDRVDVGREVLPGLRVVGMIDDAADFVKRNPVSEVIVAASALTRNELLDVYQVFGLREDIVLRMSSGLYEILTTGMRVKQIGSVALSSANTTRLTLPERVLKTAFDFFVAGLAVVVLAPLLITIAVWIKLDSPGPVIHRRRVLGTRGRTYNALKFRTMAVNAEEVLARYPELQEELNRNMKLKDDPRVTRSGRLLRKTSLDELPQLFNVLLGQMSLVGPRMITPEEADRYGQWRFNLLTVKPGITGLWQVSGRSDLSYPERVQIDMSYIRNYSLWLDVVLLARTLPAVFKRTGAY